MKLLCWILSHKWNRYSDLAVANCRRCKKQLRGKPVFKALYGKYWEKWWRLYEVQP